MPRERQARRPDRHRAGAGRGQAAQGFAPLRRGHGQLKAQCPLRGPRCKAATALVCQVRAFDDRRPGRGASARKPSGLASPSAPGAPDPLVEQVFAEIEATFREPVSAADVARTLGYTPGHLTTVLRRRTGRPLLEWITERRMIEVRRMLRETDLPLDAVAARTGLRDATYLVRRFRNRYGTTPQRWRRAERAWP
ncbi:helix-turn-helix transcriptional regulator [Actinomadura citrea]|uniref:helix-turn-helix transcriptional regulator n=1 Tax=Actinomadura citrea TaxID=46158 RepID=UPI003CE4AEC7